MNKASFLFLSATLISISLFAGFESVELSFQVYAALFCIALVGIPHGAIDHVLFLEARKTKPVYFYVFYLGLMGVYGVFWQIVPLWSMLFFLVLSAFHFGESQFSGLSAMAKPLRLVLNLAWGCSILSGLVYYNLPEIQELAMLSDDISPLLRGFDMAVYRLLLPLSTLCTLVILGVGLYRKTVNTERFFTEIYTLALIHFCFFVLPLIVGFTLYFVILHSLKVLKDEFTYLLVRRQNFSLWEFVKLLSPFTLLSIAGTTLLLYISHIEWIEISNVLLVLILISILTLPHSIVMNGFYQQSETAEP